MGRTGCTRLLLLTLLPMAFPAAASDPLDGGSLTPNLIPNPSMEDGADLPSSWSFHGDGGKGAWDHAEARAGRRSLRIDGAGEWRSAPFPLQPGRVTLLEISTRLRGSGRWGAAARVDFLGEDGTRLGKLDPQLSDEHSWQRMHWGGLAPAGTVAGVLVCYTHQDRHVTVWCDDAAVRQWTDEAPPALGSGSLPEGVRGFDFGTDDSDLQPGFARVSPRTRYREERRHGWTASVRLAGVDQPDPQYRPEAFDARGEPLPHDRTLLDPLTRDFVRGVGAARFRIDLPAGRYHLLLLAGHSTAAPAPPYFDLIVTSGPQKLTRLRKRFPGVGFVSEVVEVESGPRGVEVGLASDRFGGTWALSAALIWPEGDPAGWGEAERLQRSVEALPGDLLAPMHRVPSAPGAAAPGPGTVVTLPAGSASMAGAASPGLSADFGFAVRARHDLHGCRAETEATPPEEGGAPAEAHFWSVHDRALRYTEGYVVHDLYVVQPDELRDRLPARLAAGEPLDLWLRVRLPDGARPEDVWRVRVRFSCPGQRDAVVTAEVRALPFAADRVEAIQLLYLAGSAGRVPEEAPREVRSEAEALRAAAVQDVVDHLGSATAALWRWGVYRGAQGGFRVETAFAHEDLDDFRRAGHPARTAVVLLQPVLRQLAGRMLEGKTAARLGKHVSDPLDLPDDYWTAFGGLLEQIDTDLAQAGVELRVYNPWDEAFGDDLPVFQRASREVRRRLPEARVLCNVPAQVYYHGGEAGEDRALAEYCDIWWAYGAPTDAQRAEERRRGTWLLGGLVAEGYAGARAASGLLRWRRQEDGGAWWSYDAYTGSASTQLDGPSYGDRCLVYPTAPPSPRLAWEASRMGHEDLRYLRTLERLVGEGGEASGRLRRAVAAGARLLSELHDRVDPSSPDPLGEPADYDAVRSRVLAAIERIVAAAE